MYSYVDVDKRGLACKSPADRRLFGISVSMQVCVAVCEGVMVMNVWLRPLMAHWFAAVSPHATMGHAIRCSVVNHKVDCDCVDVHRAGHPVCLNNATVKSSSGITRSASRNAPQSFALCSK